MIRDLKYAARMLGKNPGFTIVAACSLAIGIGANSAVFSFADALLLRPLSVMKPQSVVTVASGPIVLGASTSLSYPDYVDLREHNRSFDGLVAYQYSQLGYAPDRSTVPEMAFGAFVSGNFFHVMGVEPVIGRGFRAAEDEVPGRDPVAVLGHDFWLAHFNGSHSAIGAKIRLNGIEFTIVGVAPAVFTGVDQFIKPALFVPLAMTPALSGMDDLKNRDKAWLNIKGRLRNGVDIAQAQQDLNTTFQALQRLHKKPQNQKLRVETELALRIEQSPPDAQLIVMLSMLALCVLIVACANVAGLLLSRATARRREISVRLAIGASRWQLTRQLLLENLMLAMAGGLSGIVIALAGIRLFASLPVPTDIPFSLDFDLDRRVLLFTLIASALSTLLFGVAPALRSSRADVVSALRARDIGGLGKGRLWGRNVLVSAQLAISVVLLIVAAVIFRGFQNELTQGPGFRTSGLSLMSFEPQMLHYTPAQNERFYKQLLDQIRSAPAVRSAVLTSFIPFSFNSDTRVFIPEGHTLAPGEQPPSVTYSTASEGYFKTLDVPIVRGRGFLDSDQATTTRVAVVNEHLAHQLWPGQDPIGKRLHMDDASGALVQVVGVARQAKYIWIAESPSDFVYLPFSQNQQSAMTLVAEARGGNASALLPAMRQVVQRIDPEMPVFDVRTMQDLFNMRAIQTPSILEKAVGGMGLMALVLAVIGLYGLITYSVSRRAREIGIRMAVGADRAGVLNMVLRRGMKLALAGITVGLLAGILASRAIGSMFISAFRAPSPVLFVMITIVFFVVALLAAYAPARRASLIDPMKILREE